MLEALVVVDLSFIEDQQTAARVIEDVVALFNDGAVNVQRQAKESLFAVAALVPHWNRLLARLSPGAQDVYENERQKRPVQSYPKAQLEMKSPAAVRKQQLEESVGEVRLSPIDFEDPHTRLQSEFFDSHVAPNGLEFGFAPPSLLCQLRTADNWRTRAHAVQELESLLTNTDDFESLLPFLAAFFRFIRDLLSDTNLKVTQSTLSIVSTLLTLPGVSRRANVAQLIPSCVEKLGDNKITVRQAAFRVFRGFIREVHPRLLFPHLVEALGSDNWHIREAVLHVMIAALLANIPDYEFDFCSLVPVISDLLLDPKPKVSFTALETLAVIAHTQGHLPVFEQLPQPAYQQLQARLELGALPVLQDDFIAFPRSMPASAPLIPSTVLFVPADKPVRSHSPLIYAVNSSDSTEDASMSPVIRGKKGGNMELPALRRTGMKVNMTARAAGVAKKSFGYQSKAGFSVRGRPVLRFESSRHSPLLSDQSASPVAPRRSIERVSASDQSLYSPLEHLDPVFSPESVLQQCIRSCQSQDWAEQFEMLNSLRRLLKHHSDVFRLAYLHSIVLAVVRIADSLRSSLARNSLIVIKEMAGALERSLDGDLEVLCTLVARKCADTNVFISEEAENALMALSENCSEGRVVQSLLSQAQITKSSAVKSQISLAFQIAFRRCIQNSVKIKDLDRIFSVLAGYLTDASSEVRSTARAAVSVLRLRFPSASDFERVLFRSLPDVTAKQVLVSLQDVRPALRPEDSPGVRRSLSPGKRFSTHRSTKPDEDFSAIERCRGMLESVEWKTRYEAVDALYTFLAEGRQMTRKNPKITNFVELSIKAMRDKNLSVNLHALETMSEALPLLLGSLEPHCAALLKAATVALNSANSAAREAASVLVRTLLENCDPVFSMSALSGILGAAGTKAKPALVSLVSGNSHIRTAI